MGRPRDWYPAAEHDPVPGDVEAIRELSRRCLAMADAIRDAGTGLRKIQSEGTSEALDAFRRKTGETAEKIGRVEPRYRTMSINMTNWASELGGLQRNADASRGRALNAEDDRQRCEALLLAAADDVERLRLTRQVSTAQDAVDTERRYLVGLHNNWDAGARGYASAIDGVISHDDVKDSFWDNAAGTIASIAKFSSRLSAWLGVAALAVGFIPIIGQGLAGLLGTLSLLAAAVALITNITLLATDKGGSWGEVGWAAFSVATFGLGRAMGSVAKASTLGARASGRVAVLHSFKDAGQHHATALNSMRGLLGAADGATPSVIAAAPSKLVPGVRELATRGFGGLRTGAVDDWNSVRVGATGGVSPILHGFGGYTSGGFDAVAARALSQHTDAAGLTNLSRTEGAISGLPQSFRQADLDQMSKLASQAQGQVRVALGATGASGLRDTWEVSDPSPGGTQGAHAPR